MSFNNMDTFEFATLLMGATALVGIEFCASGCVDTREQVGTIINDSQAEEVDLDFEECEVVEKLPYSLVNVIPGFNASTLGDHPRVPVYLDDKSGKDYSMVEGEGVYVSTEFFCETAVPAVNWMLYNFRGGEQCIQDEVHCEWQDCEGNLIFNQ